MGRRGRGQRRQRRASLQKNESLRKRRKREEKERGVEEALEASLTVDYISSLTRVDHIFFHAACRKLIKAYLAYLSAGTRHACNYRHGSLGTPPTIFSMRKLRIGKCGETIRKPVIFYRGALRFHRPRGKLRRVDGLYS
jgi:hypothetical protein